MLVVFRYYVTERCFRRFQNNDERIDCGRSDVNFHEFDEIAYGLPLGSVILRGVTT